jgi:hypothetical protein
VRPGLLELAAILRSRISQEFHLGFPFRAKLTNPHLLPSETCPSETYIYVRKVPGERRPRYFNNISVPDLQSTLIIFPLHVGFTSHNISSHQTEEPAAFRSLDLCSLHPTIHNKYLTSISTSTTRPRSINRLTINNLTPLQWP